jgi:ribosomal protein S18 acetylase RimI-like enzyme
MQINVKDLTLRPVDDGDEAFLFHLYSSTRADEMEAAGWDEAQKVVFLKLQFGAQQKHYQTHYPDAEHQIVLLRGVAAGRIYTAIRDDELRILDIALLPEHRNSGLGGSMIEALQAKASKMNVPVRIYVENFNPALRLFERLGFLSTEDIGTHRLMEWQKA